MMDLGSAVFGLSELPSGAGALVTAQGLADLPFSVVGDAITLPYVLWARQSGQAQEQGITSIWDGPRAEGDYQTFTLFEPAQVEATK
jgi:hypothetical protein